MSGTLYVLNGPNLNLLGCASRTCTATPPLRRSRSCAAGCRSNWGFGCDFRQTNHEGVMVDWVQEAREKAAAIAINPAGLSFRSIPLLDALKAVEQPIAEVHVTNIHRRDTLYQHSLVSLAATGVICGFGAFGYELAIRALANRLAH